MDLEPTQKCGSFEEEMTAKATLSLSSIECLSHVFKLSYNPYKKSLEAFICLLNVDCDKILQTSPAGLQGLKTERSQCCVEIR